MGLICFLWPRFVASYHFYVYRLAKRVTCQTKLYVKKLFLLPKFDSTFTRSSAITVSKVLASPLIERWTGAEVVQPGSASATVPSSIHVDCSGREIKYLPVVRQQSIRRREMFGTHSSGACLSGPVHCMLKTCLKRRKRRGA